MSLRTTTFIIEAIVLTVWLGLFGTQIKLKPLMNKFKNPKGIYLGVMIQTIFLPAWTSLLLIIFDISGYIAMAFLIVACSPGGAASNIWCLIAQSDLALSAAVTTFSTLLSAGTMPFNIWLYGRFFDEEDRDIPMEVVLPTAASIFVGMGTGIFLRYKLMWSKKALKCIAYFAIISGIVITFCIVFKIFTDQAPTIQFKTSEYFMSLMMNGTALICGICLGRFIGLTKPEAVSIGYEVSTQNLSIPLFIIFNMYPEQERVNMITVLLLFGITSLILNFIYYCIVVNLGLTNHVLLAEEVEVTRLKEENFTSF